MFISSKEDFMELRIYKGFDIKFLNTIECQPLVNGDIYSKLNVYEFNLKTKKKLDANLTSMDDNDIRWVTYEEFSLIKERVLLSIKDYNLIVKCFINNIFPDCYPIPFKISDSVFQEIKKAEENDNKSKFNGRCK